MATQGITHSVDNRNLAAYLFELSRKIRILTDKVCCLTAALGTGATAGTSSGTGSIGAGFSSVIITKTNGTGAADVTLGDSSVYPLTANGEVLTLTAPDGKVLPALTITASAGGTWKWIGVK